MLRSKLLICMMLCLELTTAQTADSLFTTQQEQLGNLETKIQSAERSIVLLDAQIKDLKSQVVQLRNRNETLSVDLLQKQKTIDSLAKIVTQNTEIFKYSVDSLGVKIQTTDAAVLNNTSRLESKTKWGIGAFALALLASVVVWLLHKKGQKKSDDRITSLKKQADELNEKIVNQFSTEIRELQKISDASKSLDEGTSAEPDHSLVKTLADRITFMEMTLYRMDNNIRGHRQLSRAIAQMKDNLLANGYEIVDMLGKEYDDGMRINASFIEDESIEPGKQIITTITKPQINYKGEMIQKAQVTVSQNI